LIVSCHKGFVLLSLGQVDAAFSEASLAGSSDDTKLGAAYIRGEGYRLQHSYDQAIGQFERVIRLDRSHSPALLALIELFYLTRNSTRMDESLSAWREITMDTDQDALVATYNQRWNFAGSERMENLKKAMP